MVQLALVSALIISDVDGDNFEARPIAIRKGAVGWFASGQSPASFGPTTMASQQLEKCCTGRDEVSRWLLGPRESPAATYWRAAAAAGTKSAVQSSNQATLIIKQLV
jgi:hypothetical protein